MSSVITVELDSAAEAALKVLMMQGRSLDEAVHYALVVTTESTLGAPAPSDASDEIAGLA